MRDIIARPEYFAMVMATGIVATGLGLDGWADASDALVVIAAAVWLATIAATLVRLVRSPAGLRTDASAPGRAFAWYAIVAACVVLGSCLARLGGAGVPAATALAGVAVVAWLALTGLASARFGRRADRPDLQSVTGSFFLWPVATQSLAIAAAVLTTDGELPAEPGVILAIVAWVAGVLLYLGTLILVTTRLVRAGQGPAGTRAAYWITMGAAAISVLAAALIVRAHVAAGRAAAPVIKDIGVVLWSAGSALYLVLVVATVLRWARTRGRPGYQPAAWVIVFPLGMYAVASWQLGTATGLTLIHRVGIIAVWPAALAWAITSAALLVAAVPSAARALSGRRFRSRPRRLGSHPDHPAGKRRYTFEALVTIAPGGSPSAPVPGPDWRGIVRAGADGSSPGLFTALVAGWDPHSSGRADAAALATIVVFGTEPAECLPVGGGFALWRGHDVGHGIVTRRIFV